MPSRAERGTYAGLSRIPASVAHLVKALGVTTLIELLPVHAYHLDEPALAEHAGSRNYWGYNTLALLLHRTRGWRRGRTIRRPSTPSSARWRSRRLHSSTAWRWCSTSSTTIPAEGNEQWPDDVSFRGIDNASWYRLMPDDPGRLLHQPHRLRQHRQLTAHPHVIAVRCMDSLRYWVAGDSTSTASASTSRRDARAHAGDRLPAGRADSSTALRQDPIAGPRASSSPSPGTPAPDGYQVGNRFLGRNRSSGTTSYPRRRCAATG